MAGALGLKLGGPRFYGDEIVDDAFMGTGRSEANATDIRQALLLYRIACVLSWGALLSILVIARF
jgi:adenosylcobinamide-phosphate synthase